LGTKETSPSAANRRSASRIGVRETPKRSESCSCRSTTPGSIAPETISSSRTRAISSAFVESDAAIRRLESKWLARGRDEREAAVVDLDRHERQLVLRGPLLEQVRDRLAVVRARGQL